MLHSSGPRLLESYPPFQGGSTVPFCGEINEVWGLAYLFVPLDCAPGKAALILQVKVLSWKAKLAPPSNESCAAAGNFSGEA